MKRVLVTGAGGQLGKSIQDLAPKYPDLDFLFLDKRDMDITHADQVMQRFREYRPDYCINCAAYTDVEEAENSPGRAFSINRDGAANVASACKETGTVLIHISTDYVFDGKKTGSYLPEDVPNPINEYGRSKYQGEIKIQEIFPDHIIVRTSWLYSKKYAPNFYLTILDKARKGMKLIVTDQERGCPTEAVNLVRYLIKLLHIKPQPGIYHFTDNLPMTRYDFAVKILKENNLEKQLDKLQKGQIKKKANRPLNSVLQVTTKTSRPQS